jgi:hypothetical protein
VFAVVVSASNAAKRLEGCEVQVAREMLFAVSGSFQRFRPSRSLQHWS